MSVKITIGAANLKQIDTLIGKIDVFLRGTAVRKAIRAVGKVVLDEAKRRVPVGDEKHNRGKPSLKSTLTSRLWERGTRFTVVVGAEYPDGAHSHLVEGWKQPKRIVISRGERKGQDTGLKAVPKPFMAPAFDTTKDEQYDAFVDTLEQAIKDASNG